MSSYVGVVGLGYVGLPLSVLFAESGFKVIGYDCDQAKIDALRKGEVYIDDISPERFENCRENFLPTSDASSLISAEFIAICVPTPIAEDKTPDTSLITRALDEVAPYVKEDAVVSIESTVYPNFTKTVAKPKLPHAHVVFSPERVDPSNKKFDLKEVPKVIGADTDIAMFKARNVYSKVFSLVEVGSTSAAEMSKLLENTYRAVNIALVNEMSRICGDLEIDVWEVIQAAATKPFGFQAFYPSLGVGGHCIPVDPYYLLHKGDSRLIRNSLEINESNVERCADKLPREIFCNPEARILILGVAYKPNVSDVRESPVPKLIEEIARRSAYHANLQAMNQNLKFHDPHVESISIKGNEYFSESDLESALGHASDVILCVNHDRYVPYREAILDKLSGSSSTQYRVFDFCGMFKSDTRVIGL